jgi:hypothetical protein
LFAEASFGRLKRQQAAALHIGFFPPKTGIDGAYAALLVRAE